MKNISKILKYSTACIFILISSCTTPSNSGTKTKTKTKTETETVYVETTPDYTMKLVYNGCYRDGIGGVDGLDGALLVAVSPDNKNVYVTGRYDTSLTVFNRDTSTGVLTYSTCFKDDVDGVNGLAEVRDLAVSADNKNVYVAGRDDNSVAVFDRDTSTGALTYSTCFIDGVDGVDGLDGAHGVAVSPDNKSVYVTAVDENSIAVFDRDTSTGALTYSTCFKDGVDGVDGLEYASNVTVSPDNKSVYVTGSIDDSVAVFNRDAATGALTYSTCFKDGVDGVDGLNGAAGLAVSPDNKNVYVTGSIDDSVVVFNRDTATGALTYSTCFKNGLDGVDGLYGAISTAVSPDNKSVYVIGGNGNSVAVFDRDTSTGALTYSTYFKNNENGVEGLDTARDVEVSPDGKNVYVTGRDSDSLAVFLLIKEYE